MGKAKDGLIIAGIIAVLPVILGLIYWGTAEHRAYGDNIIESPEYLECEAYLAAIDGVTMHDAIYYCYDLHWGRRPNPERVAMIAALHTGPLSQGDFRERYLTFGKSQVVAANREKLED